MATIITIVVSILLFLLVCTFIALYLVEKSIDKDKICANSYVIAHISNKYVTKNKYYAITNVFSDRIEIDVNGKTVSLDKYDKNFSIFIKNS